MIKVDYKANLVNFSSSILKRYGVKPFHSSINKIDSLLKGRNKIAIILMDGMNEFLLETHADVSRKFLDKCFMKITAVYPPTTVASTTALLSAKYPGETGYLGWSLPINNFSRNVDVFTNADSQTGEIIPGSNIINNLSPYENIIYLVNKHNKKKVATGVFRYPVDKTGPKTFSQFLKRIKQESKSHQLTYGYFNNPDHTIHRHGVNSKQVKKVIKEYTTKITKFAKKNKDTLIIVIADHGLIDINPININDFRDLKDLLVYSHSLEPRTPNFKVKEGKQDEFEKLFNKYLGNHFALIKNKEIENNHIFTSGKMSEQAKQFLGDFIAIPKDNSALTLEGTTPYAAHHAGNSKEEMIINVTVFNEE